MIWHQPFSSWGWLNKLSKFPAIHNSPGPVAMTIIKSIALLKYYMQPYVPPVITLLQIIVNQVLYYAHMQS